jgi:hypothetical protein
MDMKNRQGEWGTTDGSKIQIKTTFGGIEHGRGQSALLSFDVTQSVPTRNSAHHKTEREILKSLQIRVSFSHSSRIHFIHHEFISFIANSFHSFSTKLKERSTIV